MFYIHTSENVHFEPQLGSYCDVGPTQIVHKH